MKFKKIHHLYHEYLLIKRQKIAILWQTTTRYYKSIQIKDATIIDCFVGGKATTTTTA